VKIASLTLAAALAIASPSLAQDVYVGGGVAHVNGTSDNVVGGGGSGASELSTGAVSLILGIRRNMGTTFWGLEANADLSFGAEAENSASGATCSVGATGSYLCSHESTLRLVGIYGVSLGQGTEVFGSLGIGRLKGDFATSITTVESASISGVTVGLGLGHDFGSGIVARGEVIHDRFTNTKQATFLSEYSATTLRVSVLRKF
jgi:opacity protein-like surface antigen